MDWQTLCDGLKAWFARESGIPVTQVYWDGEDAGMREYPFADLKLASHSAQHGDELRFIDQGPGANLGAEVVGNRRRVLSCRVRSRDQRPGARAYAILERVHDRLMMPSNQDTLASLNVGVQSVASMLDLSNVWDHRQESEAALDIALNFSSSEVDTDSGVGTIESVEFGGSVHNGAETITVPDQTVP